MTTMTEMTPRQRLLAVLSGEPVDRVPIWLLFPYHPLAFYVNVREHPKYRAVFEYSKQHCVMLNRRCLNSGHQFKPAVTVRHTTFLDHEVQCHRTVVEYKGRTLESWTRNGNGTTDSKHLLETEEDLAFYASLPVETNPAVIEAALDHEIPRLHREKTEFPEKFGAMMLDLGEPINVLYHNAKLDEYAVWSLTANDVVISLLDKLMERHRVIYRWALKHQLADVYFNVGSELAAPPLVSRQTFQRWVVPYARELIGMIHAAGKKSIQHFHGQIKEVLPDFLDMGTDALHTIEAPPIGNCTLSEAYKVVGDRMALIGNIQYDDFRALTPAQMREAVKAVLAEAHGHRFILSPTAGPFDPEPSDQLLANYQAFMRAGWEFGRQKR